MITIEVSNAEELAIKEKGWFQVNVGKTFGVDIQRKVEEEVAKQLKAQLAKQGVKADVSVKYGPSQKFCNMVLTQLA